MLLFSPFMIGSRKQIAKITWASRLADPFSNLVTATKSLETLNIQFVSPLLICVFEGTKDKFKQLAHVCCCLWAIDRLSTLVDKQHKLSRATNFSFTASFALENKLLSSRSRWAWDFDWKRASQLLCNAKITYQKFKIKFTLPWFRPLSGSQIA